MILKHEAIKTQIVLTLIFTSLSAFSGEGTSDGGGGIGVRCQNGKLELLDLHEAKILGLKLLDQPSSEQEAIALVANKLGTHYALPDSRSGYIKAVESSYIAPLFAGHSIQNPETGKTVQVKYVLELPLSPDIGQYQTLPGCNLEQIAYMNDKTSSLEIVKSKWDALDLLSRSALIAHEIFYFMDRYQGIEHRVLPDGQTTSERARLFVGRLFSQNGVQPKYELVPVNANEYRACGRMDQELSNYTHFYAVKTAVNQTTAVFRLIHGRSSLFEMTAVLSGIHPEDFDTYENEFSYEVPLHVERAELGLSFAVRITKQKWAQIKFQVTVNKSGTALALGPEQELLCWQN